METIVWLLVICIPIAAVVVSICIESSADINLVETIAAAAAASEGNSSSSTYVL